MRMFTSQTVSDHDPPATDGVPIGALVVVGIAAAFGAGRGPVVVLERTWAAVDKAREVVASLGRHDEVHHADAAALIEQTLKSIGASGAGLIVDSNFGNTGRIRCGGQ
jgi:hypothetical protein